MPDPGADQLLRLGGIDVDRQLVTRRDDVTVVGLEGEAELARGACTVASAEVARSDAEQEGSGKRGKRGCGLALALGRLGTSSAVTTTAGISATGRTYPFLTQTPVLGLFVLPMKMVDLQGSPLTDSNRRPPPYHG
jgi:hypothetical protein